MSTNNPLLQAGMRTPSGSGKMVGFIILGVLVLVAIIAIVIITTKTTCSVPSDNPCPRDPTTGEQLYPYCNDDLGQPICKTGEDICGSTSGACPGEVISGCDYINNKWSCSPKGVTPGIPTSNACSIESDGVLQYPDPQGNTKAVKHYKSYKKIEISGTNACELSACENGYTVSDFNDTKFCVKTDIGQACNDQLNAHLKGDIYSKYPDDNAIWKIAYAYPDGDTPYCAFEACINGYTFDPSSNTCTRGTGDCGALPEHADEATSSCNNGKWYITNCNTDGGIKYKPASDNQSCVADSCVNICASVDKKCVLNPQDSNDIRCAVYQKQPLGHESDAILNNASQNGNVYLASDGDLYAVKTSNANPFGGCGTFKFPFYMTDNDTGKCEEVTIRARFKFSDIDQDKPGCNECAPIYCPPGVVSDWSKCMNYDQSKGCENLALAGTTWDDACKKTHPAQDNTAYGAIEDSFMPLYISEFRIAGWSGVWRNNVCTMTVIVNDKNCNVLSSKLWGKTEDSVKIDPTADSVTLVGDCGIGQSHTTYKMSELMPYIIKQVKGEVGALTLDFTDTSKLFSNSQSPYFDQIGKSEIKTTCKDRQ